MKPAYIKETIHNNKRRAVWHDYRSRCIYMITINAAPGAPSFGCLRITEDIAKSYVEPSAAGNVITKEISVTPKFNPEIKILEIALMPDHVHVLLFVIREMNRSLGDVVQAIKAAATSKIRKLTGNQSLLVFEEGFHDRILRDKGQLRTLYAYLRDNPRRLAVRRANPDYFRRIGNMQIAGRTVHVYGNLQLLECPFKEQVVVHRADTPETRAANCDRWFYIAANGGVLVSPFISPDEKAVRSTTEELGGRFILITNKPMDERSKPSGHNFELCEAGRMLIISMGSTMPLSRNMCLEMNECAAAVCGSV